MLLKAKHLFDFLFQFGLFKRAALDFVEAFGVNQILGAQEPQELTHVQLGNQDLFVTLEYIGQICGQRVQMSQMQVADAAAQGASVADVRKKLEVLLGPGFQVEAPAARAEQFESISRVFSLRCV